MTARLSPYLVSLVAFAPSLVVPPWVRQSGRTEGPAAGSAGQQCRWPGFTDPRTQRGRWENDGARAPQAGVQGGSAGPAPGISPGPHDRAPDRGAYERRQGRLMRPAAITLPELVVMSGRRRRVCLRRRIRCAKLPIDATENLQIASRIVEQFVILTCSSWRV